jgi:hypothetical protein
MTASANSRKPPVFRGDAGLQGKPKRGTAAPLAFRKSLSCASCGAAIELYASGKSRRTVCASCGSVLDLSTPEMKVLETFKQKAPQPLIPLGRRGKLHGAEWECLALLVRKDVESSFEWREYLLFNPYKGYRFLMESAGHWSWIVMTHDPGEKIGSWVTHRGKKYRGFHKGRARVVSVVGEVYWEVKANEEVYVFDAVLPPFSVSIETSGEEETWSLSEYLDRRRVAEAFKVPLSEFPPLSGVAPHQPNPHGRSDGLLKVSLWGSIAIATLLQSGACVVSGSRKKLEQTYTLANFLGQAPDLSDRPWPGPLPVPMPSPSLSPTPAPVASPSVQGAALPEGSVAPSPVPSVKLVPSYMVTDSFELKSERQWVDVELYAPVSQEWVEAEVSLIDEDGSEEASSVVSAEYYSGVDGGESWSEGSQEGTVSFPGVEKGRYRLRIEAQSNMGPQNPLRFRVRAGGVSYLNYFLVLLLLSVGFILPKPAARFEKNRWGDSTV